MKIVMSSAWQIIYNSKNFYEVLVCGVYMELFQLIVEVNLVLLH